MSEPDNPLGFLFSGSDDLAGALHRFADLLSWTGGAVNWDLAQQLATQGLGDSEPTAADQGAVDDAVRLAEHWLDSATSLPARITVSESWSRRRWVTETLDGWKALVDPVAERVVEAMGSGLPEELASVAGPITQVMRRVGGLMFAAQIGQGLAGLAQEVLSSTDVGVPLAAPGRGALVTVNVSTFGAGLGVQPADVALYLALREAAYHRLYGGVPWLRAHVFDAVDGYARGITIDRHALEEAMGRLDPSDPESLQTLLGGGLFEPSNTPTQEAALRRLETALALVEGWVDHVVAAAANEHHMPAAPALRETINRRRATGGPAEQTFATLVGLELRPRRLRDAASLWQALADARGADGRDAVWAHPDLLPDASDLDDPTAYAEKEQTPFDISDLTEPPESAGD